MSVSGIGQKYDYFETVANYVPKKMPVKETISKTAKQTVSLSISDSGKNALREMTSIFEPASDYTRVKEMTIKNTNEVAWEHYTAMRDMSSLTLKDGNYNTEDVMKSIMDTYESRYSEIVKEHENGDREVSYGLTGKRSLTLDEDLAGLDEAFKLRLANLKGYIACQQTNKAFENPDSSWYFRRNTSQNEVNARDTVEISDTQYVSFMEQAKEKFLTVFESINNKKGTAVSILSDIMKMYR